MLEVESTNSGEIKRQYHRASNWTTEFTNEFLSLFQTGEHTLRFVRFLYIIRCPHSRQRIGSRGLISFFAPQSVKRGRMVMDIM